MKNVCYASFMFHVGVSSVKDSKTDLKVGTCLLVLINEHW